MFFWDQCRAHVFTSPGKVTKQEITHRFLRWERSSGASHGGTCFTHRPMQLEARDLLPHASSLPSLFTPLYLIPFGRTKEHPTDSQSQFPLARHRTPHIARHHTSHSHTLDTSISHSYLPQSVLGCVGRPTAPGIARPLVLICSLSFWLSHLPRVCGIVFICKCA